MELQTALESLPVVPKPADPMSLSSLPVELLHHIFG